MTKHVVRWGKDHEKTFDTYKEASAYAYEKGFNFTVTINNTIYTRPF